MLVLFCFIRADVTVTVKCCPRRPRRGAAGGPSDRRTVSESPVNLSLRLSPSPSLSLPLWPSLGRPRAGPGPGRRRDSAQTVSPRGVEIFFFVVVHCDHRNAGAGREKGCQRAAWRPRVTVHGWRRSHCSRAAMTSTILLYRCPLLPPRPPRLLARLHGRVLLCPALHPGAETKKRGRAASREYSRRRGHPRWGAWCGPTGAR